MKQHPNDLMPRWVSTVMAGLVAAALVYRAILWLLEWLGF